MVKALVRSSRQERYVATAVALATLTACSAGNPIGTTSDGPLANVPAYRSPQRAGQPVAGDVKNSVVYVSQEADNSISVFRLDGKRIRRITSRLNYPQGIFADAQSTLYVANRGSNDVLEFRRGATSPFKVLIDRGNQPEDVTVCPNGTVYVANILNASSGGGNIAVYTHGSRNPTGMLTYDGGEFFFLTCDAKGNLFGTLVVGTSGTVAAFPGGRQKGARRLPIFFAGNPSGIKADNAGNLLVAGQGNGVEEFTESGKPTGLQVKTVGLNEIALSPDGKLLLGATAKGAVQYTFPGGTLNHTYRARGQTPIGAAFDPGNEAE